MVANLAVIALLAFGVWTSVLALTLVAWRVRLVRAGEFRWNEFPPHQPHGPDAYWRLCRVLANAQENIGPFAAVILGGVALGCDAALFHVLAVAAVAARFIQGAVHLSSTRSRAVLRRGTAFLVQQLALVGIVITALVTMGR